MEYFNLSQIISAVISGIISGVTTGIILYFVFNKIFINKPKVRLYIEPNPISKKVHFNDNEFEISLYLNNKSKTSAEKLRCMANFGNSCKIINCSEGILLRKFGEEEWIQFDVNLMYCYSDTTNTEIGKIRFRYDNKTEDMEIIYNIVAKNIPCFSDTLKLKIS